MTAFEQLLIEEREKTQAAVRNFLKRKMADYGNLDRSFYDYLKNIETYSLRGGKWHRPMLTRLAYQLKSNSRGRGDIVKGSGGVELLHRFILIHDDIFDGDLERHGGPTLEAVYKAEQDNLSLPHPVTFFDKGMAMISGDLLHTFALEMVRESGFEQTTLLNVLRGFHETLAVTAAGWRLETLLKQKSLADVKSKEIEKTMWLVSGLYSILWPLRIGQLFSGGTYGHWNKNLEEFGKHIGLAFQIQDDILGLFGSKEKTGKPVGHDFREGKKTLLLLYAYAEGTMTQKAFLESHLGKPISEKKLERIQKMIINTGALDNARSEITSHLLAAQSALYKMENNGEVVTVLRELGDYLGNRNL